MSEIIVEDDSGVKRQSKEEYPARFPCFKCEKPLFNVLSPASERNQPFDACAFTTHGAYGSTVFDECDGATIEINVCDECLVAGQKAQLVGYWPGYPRRQMKLWEGE